MSTRRRFGLLLLPSVIIFNYTPESPTTASASPPAGKEDRSAFGSFEHRGIMYDISDLMDPQFRANHDDPYVREFDPMLDFRLDGSSRRRFKDWTDMDGPRMRMRGLTAPFQYDSRIPGMLEDLRIELEQIRNSDEDLEQSLEPEP